MSQDQLRQRRLEEGARLIVHCDALAQVGRGKILAMAKYKATSVRMSRELNFVQFSCDQ